MWRNGRRNGLKIRSRESGVWVRIPSSAPSENAILLGKFVRINESSRLRTVAHENARKHSLFAKYSSSDDFTSRSISDVRSVSIGGPLIASADCKRLLRAKVYSALRLNLAYSCPLIRVVYRKAVNVEHVQRERTWLPLSSQPCSTLELAVMCRWAWACLITFVPGIFANVSAALRAAAERPIRVSRLSSPVSH